MDITKYRYDFLIQNLTFSCTKPSYFLIPKSLNTQYFYYIAKCIVGNTLTYLDKSKFRLFLVFLYIIGINITVMDSIYVSSCFFCLISACLFSLITFDRRAYVLYLLYDITIVIICTLYFYFNEY